MKVLKYLKNILRYIYKGIYKTGGETYVNVSALASNQQLKNKTVLITGGSSGIGYAIAERLIESGAHVIITGRNYEKLKMACNKLGEMSDYIVNDISNVCELDNLMNEAIVKSKGELSCLINNAGVPSKGEDILKVEEEDYDELMKTNLKGPFFLTKLFYKYLLDNKLHGSIIMISSNAVQINYPADYPISKAALLRLGLGIAKQGSSKNIRCNIVCPGVTISNILPEFNINKKGNLYRDDMKDKRWHLAEEIAEVVEFLVSDRSVCLNGQVLVCDGGDSLR